MSRPVDSSTMRNGCPPADLMSTSGAGGRDRSGEAVQQQGVESADVEAELERVRGGHAGVASVLQALLDVSSLVREVAGTVRGDRVLREVDAVARVTRDELRAHARFR